MVNKITEKQIQFEQIVKSEDTVRISVKLEGKTYNFTVIKKDIEKLSDKKLTAKYGEKFTKLIEVSKVVELKKGEQLAQKNGTLTLKGRETAEETELHPLSEKLSINLPKSLSPQINKIQEIYSRDTIKVKRDKAEKTAEKIETTQVLLDVLCKKLAKGKAKVVWIPKHMSDNALHLENKVVYTPVQGGFFNTLFSLNEREIKEEIDLQKTLKSESLTILGHEPKYIAVDLEIVQNAEGKFIATGEKAEGDLERLMKKEQSPLQAAKLAAGYIRGMDELADLGYAAGDVKPDNALGYKAENNEINGPIVKLADLGKARKVNDGSQIYTGNPRFAPPEGRLSKAGDVFGLGMVSLRVLEERILEKTGETIINSYEGKKPDFTGVRGRGIEQLRAGDKAFPHNPLSVVVPKTAANLQLQENKMKSYVDAFEREFVANFPEDPMSAHIHKYCELVKETFNSDPTQRPTAKEFKERYEAFLKDVENS